MHITRKTDQPLYIGFYIIDVVCEHTFPIDYIKFCLMSATGIKETKLLMIKNDDYIITQLYTLGKQVVTTRNEVPFWRLFYLLVRFKGRLFGRIKGVLCIVCTILFNVFFKCDDINCYWSNWLHEHT